MNSIERRDFLKGSATGVFAFTVGGVEVLLSAREAHTQNVPFRLLKANEAETIEALGEPKIAHAVKQPEIAVDNASQALNSGRKFAQLSPSEQHDFVDAMRQNKVQAWQGPGGSFVYLLLRSDAVDVVYGTMEGYEALGIPYMPHIAPDKRW